MNHHHIKLLLTLCIIILWAGCAVPADDEEETATGDDSATAELPWEGELHKFVINSAEGVRLNDPDEEAGTAYLTIPHTTVRNTRWELGINLSYNPSANNYVRFYLASSSPILSGELDGYFLQIGGAKDNVALYRQEGGQPRLLASGRELMKGNNSPKLYVKVECDNNGYWTFWTRLATETEYTLEKQVKDTQIETSLHAGIYCVYTKTRSSHSAFHHIRLSTGVETVTPSEEETPGETQPGITELPEDAMGMLLFNEIMYDPASDGAEYVEIYNPGEKDITLPVIYLYKMYETGKVFSTTALQHSSTSQPLTIPAKGYRCFTKYVDRVIQKHGVEKDNLIEISKFPQLSNDGGYLALSSSEKAETGHTFDVCRFAAFMHDTDGKTTGISLEKKSPELSSLNANWRSSRHATGGTPGTDNR